MQYWGCSAAEFDGQKGVLGAAAAISLRIATSSCTVAGLNTHGETTRIESAPSCSAPAASCFAMRTSLWPAWNMTGSVVAARQALSSPKRSSALSEGHSPVLPPSSTISTPWASEYRASDGMAS